MQNKTLTLVFVSCLYIIFLIILHLDYMYIDIRNQISPWKGVE